MPLTQLMADTEFIYLLLIPNFSHIIVSSIQLLLDNLLTLIGLAAIASIHRLRSCMLISACAFVYTINLNLHLDNLRVWIIEVG